MNEEIREALANEVLSQLNELGSLELGSREQQTVVENITKLYRLGLEDVKADSDYDEKLYRREADEKKQDSEEQNRKNQMAEQTKDRYVRYGLEAAGIILPLLFYAKWIDRGYTLETTGTYTSKTLLNLFGKFKPTKK